MFVANDAFLLSTICMKPYVHKKLLESYNLLKLLPLTRKTTENIFGILSNRLRIFWSKIYLTVEIVTKILIASCFHNLLSTKFLSRVLSSKGSGGMKIFCTIKLFSELDEGTLQLKQRMSGIYFENILLGQAKYNGNGNILI